LIKIGEEIFLHKITSHRKGREDDDTTAYKSRRNSIHDGILCILGLSRKDDRLLFFPY
jgi:hypothetical protein